MIATGEPYLKAVHNQGKIQGKAMAKNNSIFELLGFLPKHRQRQAWRVLAFIVVGAFMELVSLGAILPFLAIMANPDKAYSYPALQALFLNLGWQKPADLLLPVTAMFVIASLSAGAVRLSLNWVTNRFVFDVGYELGVQVYGRALSQPYAYHVQKNSSSTLAAINKVQMVVNGMLVPLMQAVTSAIVASFIVVALLWIDPVTAICAAAGFAFIYVGISLLMRARLKKNGLIVAAAQTGRMQCVQEGMGGIRDIILDGTEQIFIDRFSAVDEPLRHAQTVNNFAGGAPRYVIEAVGMALIAGLAMVLSARVGGLQHALPVLGALALGAQKLMPLVQQGYSGWTRVASSRALLADVLEVLRLPQPEVHQHVMEPLKFEHSIRFENLGFSYAPDLPAVLRGINLTIPKGAKVGFVGETGSGKSTTLDLFMGLLTASEGKLLVDGEEIGPNNQKRWQKHIAHVPQAIYLIDASIERNIAFGVPEGQIDSQRVRDAAKQAQISDFIDKQPNKYQTSVGERGVRLSGGQRQRIGIARALYRQADILVLDEATSALDTDTEADVMKGIRDFGKSITIIIVAHRISTLNFCDTIVSIKNGILTETKASDFRPSAVVGP